MQGISIDGLRELGVSQYTVIIEKVVITLTLVYARSLACVYPPINRPIAQGESAHGPLGAGLCRRFLWYEIAYNDTKSRSLFCFLTKRYRV